MSAGIYVELGNEIKIPLPDNWIVATDGGDFPFQLVDTNLTSDIMIFKSEIPPSEIITNDEALKQSVQGVIDEVILSLPEARILSNTGYFEKYRTGFVLEFLSFDTVNVITLRHRLLGFIYLHPDGHQLLFTVWAKSGEDTYPAVENSIKTIQDGFNYSGPRTGDVFNPSRGVPTYLYLILFMLLGLFFFMRARQLQRSRVRFEDDEKFWRCECGRLNPLHQASCRRCGRYKIPQQYSS
ncbi:MAG: hypothetical protein JXA92_05300 [candidate division Zixibacteria bacterium]|nr:hypothetical protein [candidate division Zixibacteria bacterium]